MKNAKKMLALLLVVAMLAAITACSGGGGSSDTSTENAGSNADSSGEKSLLDAKPLSNPVVTIMSHYSLWQGFKDTFKEKYGGEIEEILVPVTDYMSKTSSMLMSGDALDGIVRDSDSSIQFVTFVSRSLIQPFDQFIDLDEPIYDRIRDHTEQAKWNGKYYFVGHNNNANEMVLYNVKLFEQVGLDTPWELYQRDEWTWDAMKDAAEMLAQDTTQDGEIDIYGVALSGPQFLLATTGKILGEIMENDIQLNLRDNDVSKALEYTRNLVFNNDFSLSQPTGWAMAFSRERLAMALVPAWVVQTPEVRGIAEAGNLGIAPIPRDPQNDKYSTNAAYIGWVLAKDAPNPEGLVAFNKCMIYENSFNEEQKDERYEELKASNFFTDENMEQYQTVRQNPDRMVDWGRGLTHSYLWEFWAQENPWTTYVESVEPIILAQKNEAIQFNE